MKTNLIRRSMLCLTFSLLQLLLSCSGEDKTKSSQLQSGTKDNIKLSTGLKSDGEDIPLEKIAHLYGQANFDLFRALAGDGFEEVPSKAKLINITEGEVLSILNVDSNPLRTGGVGFGLFTEDGIPRILILNSIEEETIARNGLDPNLYSIMQVARFGGYPLETEKVSFNEAVDIAIADGNITRISRIAGVYLLFPERLLDHNTRLVPHWRILVIGIRHDHNMLSHFLINAATGEIGYKGWQDRSLR